MKLSLVEESDPTDYDVQLLDSSTNLPNFDLLPQFVHMSEGDMLS
jgi:hypothetical protein